MIKASFRLHNGMELPMVGLGMWELFGEEAVQSMGWACEAGYRLFDTAAYYHNEKDVGRGIKACGVPRKELFITSKLYPCDMVEGRQETAFRQSLEDLGLEYLDLYLLHWPIGDVEESWRVLERLYEAGLVRAIGVSNFQPCHLDKLLRSARITPMVDQIETHPYLVQQGAVDYCLARGIAVEAWGPMGKGRELSDPAVLSIAEKHGRTPAQVVLRYHNQRGVVVIPKSKRRERIWENADIFGFALDPADMAALSALDRGKTTRFYPYEYDPEDFGCVPAEGMRGR